MGTRSGSHQLSSGLMVSGRPERQPKERPPAMASRTVIYTGGDVKTSGELGRMYGVDISGGENPPKIPPRPPGAATRSGPIPGVVGPKFTNSGPMSKLSSSSSFSGPVTPIQPTGLITSDQQGTPPGSNRRSGQLDTAAAALTPSSFKKANYGSAVTSLGGEMKLGFRVSLAVWVLLVVAVMGLVAAVFLIAAVKKAVILAVAVAALVPVVAVVVWNFMYRKKRVLGFLKKFTDTELRNAVDGQYVKVTGVIHIPGIFCFWNFG